MFLDVLLGEIACEPYKRGRYWYFGFGDDNYYVEIRLSEEQARVVTKIANWKGR